MSRNCPISGQPMESVKLHGVQVEVSPHGMWLDRKELYLLTEAERRESDGKTWQDWFRKPVRPGVDRNRVLHCPVTGEEMKVIEYRDVFIDVSSAGVWLDVGEYEAILNNLRLDDGYLRGVALRLSEAQL
ncbi:MAG: zf-TFIIB domain-containing protein [Myxococcota bacterium]|nr:zf-TFIIB domain-containing protein [Myxococcota bacterium]